MSEKFEAKKGAPTLQAAAQKQEDALRSLPHAIDTEKSLLSTMLQDPVEFIGFSQEQALLPKHFYHPAHQTLFKFILELYEKNEPIELISLTQKLMDRGDLENIGGAGVLTEIFTYQPTAAHFPHHLEMVKDKHVLRSVITSCTDSIGQAYDGPEDVAIFLDQVEEQVLEIRNQNETNEETSINDAMKQVMTNLQDMILGKGTIGIKTGYQELDRMSGGLKPSEMFIIAARPSMGKTSFMMNLVEHVCLDQGLPAMVFSCEMSTPQIVERLLYSRSRYKSQDLKNGLKPTKADLQRIKRSSEEILNAKLFIDDTASITINDLRAKARRKKRDENIQLIAVDYLQLMRSHSAQAANSREREVAEISSGLKAIAKELEIPVIVLAQLNRGPESRGGTPRMSDLRESGSIEQDADLVGLLYRSSYYQEKSEGAGSDDNQEAPPEDDGKAELLLAKNRNGETGSVPLTFIKELMRFENRAFDHE